MEGKYTEHDDWILSEALLKLYRETIVGGEFTDGEGKHWPDVFRGDRSPWPRVTGTRIGDSLLATRLPQGRRKRRSKGIARPR